eukprot:TRINITY_DN80289_c0_g1_i1.p1 TRINITY_DN80289_c0_g1~~TRINITY_DN80289_c0_g1_i1.p1  ORF type:complete len:111 (-),score=11.90 TRINITY_DN80289_c0_g1_i1:91-423(-)
MEPGQFTQTEKTLQACRFIISKPDCRADDDKASFTDNACGAFAKVLYYHCDPKAQQTQTDFNQFLAMLPLKQDPEESQPVHKLLMTNLKNGHELCTLTKAQVMEALKRVA